MQSEDLIISAVEEAIHTCVHVCACEFERESQRVLPVCVQRCDGVVLVVALQLQGSAVVTAIPHILHPNNLQYNNLKDSSKAI